MAHEGYIVTAPLSDDPDVRELSYADRTRALQQAADRYIAGEIDAEEYERQVLRDGIDYGAAALQALADIRRRHSRPWWQWWRK